MTEPLPAGLAPWAWQKAAHLLVPAPAAPGPSTSTSPERTPDLAHLLEAIGAAHADGLAPHGYAPHDLAPLGLALLGRLPTEGDDEQLRLAADALRAEIAGDTVTYVVNRNLNVSNHCVKHCSFCAFRRDAGDQGAYWLSEAELEARAAEAQQLGATELCIQGGLNPAATINGSQLAYAERKRMGWSSMWCSSDYRQWGWLPFQARRPRCSASPCGGSFAPRSSRLVPGLP